MKILIIEDDRKIIDAITFTLRVGWPEAKVISANRGEEGIELVEKKAPDAIILDLGLPDIDGCEVIEQVRLFSAVPILILTVRTDETSVVKALELGAEEYVTKPFRPLELIARLKRLLRQHGRLKNEQPIIWGDFYFDHIRRRLVNGNREIQLTGIESIILRELMRNAPDVVTHTVLAENIWGDLCPGATDSIKGHIRHLREKIEEDPSKPRIILTNVGVGYSIA